MPSIVAVVRCDTYDQERVEDTVRRGIDLLGGIGCYARPGERVLIKPNALWATDPEQSVVTHPAVFRAVATLLKNTGAALTYGDSPGGFLGAAHTLKRCGIAAIAEELGIKAAEFDRGKAVSFPAGRASKQLFIAHGALDAASVISLPKLKTHGLVRLTCAVKNQYGCVPGIVKGEYHGRFPDAYDFSALLADITALLRPRLYVVDAVWAMEGNGPQGGDPKRLACLLFGSDPVAIDTIACRIVDLDPAFVPTIEAARAAGLGTDRMEEITLAGDPLEGFIDRTFRVQRSRPHHMPRGRTMRWIRSLFTLRPAIRAKRCTRCGTCVQACPVDPKALAQRKEQEVPRYDYRRCIRCFCCQELCPSKAIDVRAPLLRRLLPIAPYLGLLASHVNNQLQRLKERRTRGGASGRKKRP